MFHDKTLHKPHTSAMDFALVYKLNHYAAALLWRVRDAERMGHQILNREWLGSQFNKRQWTLATKGSRPMDGRKVLDKTAAPDGLEFYGIIVCHKDRDHEGRTKTVWLIGSVAAEEIQEKLEQRDEYYANQTDEVVIDGFDDDAEEQASRGGIEEQSAPESVRETFKRGVLHGRRRQQAESIKTEQEIAEKSLLLGKAFSDSEWLETMGHTRSVHRTPLSISYKAECITRLVNGDCQDASSGPVTGFDPNEGNPNIANLKELLRIGRETENNVVF